MVAGGFSRRFPDGEDGSYSPSWRWHEDDFDEDDENKNSGDSSDADDDDEEMMRRITILTTINCF